MSILADIDLNYTKTDILPKGDYTVIVTDAKPIKKEKDGVTTVTVQLQLQVIEGQFQNKKIPQFLMISSTDTSANKQTACNIGKRTLGGICEAIGTNINALRSGDLMGVLGSKPFIVSVVVRPASGNFEESNGIAKVMPRTGTAFPPQQPQPQMPVQPQMPPAQQPQMPQQPRQGSPWGG